MIHVMLPVQYLRRSASTLAEPQLRLMAAVMQTVLDDLQGTAYARATGTRPEGSGRARRQAIEFVTNRDRSWPYSFDNICDAIGLDAERIRRSVLDRSYDDGVTAHACVPPPR
jgi:hypothetical protein